MNVELSIEQLKEIIHALTVTDHKYLNDDDYRGLMMHFRYALDKAVDA